MGLLEYIVSPLLTVFKILRFSIFVGSRLRHFRRFLWRSQEGVREPESCPDAAEPSSWSPWLCALAPCGWFVLLGTGQEEHDCMASLCVCCVPGFRLWRDLLINAPPEEEPPAPGTCSLAWCLQEAKWAWSQQQRFPEVTSKDWPVYLLKTFSSPIYKRFKSAQEGLEP